MRLLRNEHREDKDLITFDLENVITLPHAEISSFFYKQKLTLYNLTADVSIGKKVIVPSGRSYELEEMETILQVDL